MLLVLTAAALLLAACGTATPTASKPIVVPTKAPTTAPTQAAPTEAKPTTEPTTKPAEPTKAPTTKPQPTVAPTAAPSAMPEATAEAFGTAQTVDKLSILPTTAERLAVSGSDKPTAGNIFVVVSLTVQNTSQADTLKFDPAMIMLEPGAGAKPLAPLSLTSLADDLKAQDLKPQAKITGRLAFEVPQTDLSLRLMFQGADKSEHYWQLPDPTLGTELRLGDLALTPISVERMPTLGTDKPKDGDEFVLVTLNIQNLSGTSTIQFDPIHLLVMPSAGAKGLEPAALASLKDQIQAQQLKPGASVKGVVAFEVPKSDTNLEFLYQADQNQTARWALQG